MVATLIHGDSREVLRGLPESSVDTVLCDPPYEISFMGRKWDNTGIAYDPEFWAEALRVLKPGGHLLAFGACRTYHRIAVAIEDAGAEIRDCLQWIFGTGFPKSHCVSKAIDKKLGVEREVVGVAANQMSGWNMDGTTKFVDRDITVPGSEKAKEYDGWGTALKPAYEPIILARKPIEGTIADNVLKHGTGGINIDASRVGDEEMAVQMSDGTMRSGNTAMAGGNTGRIKVGTKTGRWPSNVLLDQNAAEALGAKAKFFTQFHYSAKASRKEREAGLEVLPGKTGAQAVNRKEGSAGKDNPRAGAGRAAKEVKNHHPTVKPVSVMRWLAKLATPEGGVILDPFMGSGTTGIAAVLEGFDFIGVEREEEYHRIAETRIKHWQRMVEEGS